MDREALAVWCERHLGAPPAEGFLQTGHRCAVHGVRLTDGRDVVIKIRRAMPSLGTCVEVQRRLWERGFPCPRPLVGPVPFGEFRATVEAYVPGGSQPRPDADAAWRSAAALVRLVASAPSPRELPEFGAPPPWVRWDHNGPEAWPPADDRDDDLNAYPDPRWLADVAWRSRVRLRACQLPPVVGHGDWYRDNVLWRGSELHVVHDWDSVICQPEAVIAGAAAALFGTHAGEHGANRIAPTALFLDAYADTRCRAWSAEERQVGWAAGLWLIAFDAKKASLDGCSPEWLMDELTMRLQLAGVAIANSSQAIAAAARPT